MKKIKRSIMGCGLLVLLTSCASDQSWYHTEIVDPQLLDRQFAIDEGQCLARAHSAVHVPQIRQNQGPVYGAGDAFAKGLVNGMNQGAAGKARKAQDRIFHGCMYERGWTDKPVVLTPAENASLSSDIFSVQVYETPREEWLASVDEFLNIFPIYRESNNALEALDALVKGVAQKSEAELWRGPEILVKAHDEVAAQGLVVMSEERDVVLQDLYRRAASGSVTDQNSLALLYVNNKGPGGGGLQTSSILDATCSPCRSQG